jgi:hypothetical protein
VTTSSIARSMWSTRRWERWGSPHPSPSPIKMAHRGGRGDEGSRPAPVGAPLPAAAVSKTPKMPKMPKMPKIRKVTAAAPRRPTRPAPALHRPCQTAMGAGERGDGDRRGRRAQRAGSHKGHAHPGPREPGPESTHRGLPENVRTVPRLSTSTSDEHWARAREPTPVGSRPGVVREDTGAAGLTRGVDHTCRSGGSASSTC